MKIGVFGASGRMGRMLIEAILADVDCQLTVALDTEKSPYLGHDAAQFLGKTSGVVISSDLSQIKLADCMIDFTRPEGTLLHLAACSQHGVKMVIGTTGFDEGGHQQIKQASEKIAIVFAPNMSVGVNASYALLELAAKLLVGYDVEITEAHHKMKVDAPSGTALKMGEVIAQSQHKNLVDCAEFARHGHTGARKEGSIGFSVIRGGDVVGDHTVMFLGTGERIEIRHLSTSRASYAAGSVRAAKFLKNQENGLFDMKNVLK
jgi:4-hydroxy-tetrahydrodipicolinate reductase